MRILWYNKLSKLLPFVEQLAILYPEYEFVVKNQKKSFTEFPSKNTDFYVTFAGSKASRPNIRCTTAFRMLQSRIRNLCEQSNKIHVILEAGRINRKNISVSIGDIGSWGDYGSLIERKGRRFDFRVAPISDKKNGCVLFCGQVPTDAQITVPDYNKWLQETLFYLKISSKNPVVYRPHPKLSRNDKLFHERVCKQLKIDICDKKTLLESFEKARVVVAMNSNSLVDALKNGIPISCLGGKGSSFVEHLSQTNVRDIDRLILPPQEKIVRTFERMTHLEYTPEEIGAGLGVMELITQYSK
ncbi:hypothetical protein TetV_415 [Tetraselmis virus 1]|uniref:Capsule polysaccharide biosynthesis protein n=1 Tax=Tetraselmis virus 1 TaxID=2060617 RepID=A0A2P0VNK4_9VIRU|nr:hypothetical protein QJ968_gp639 [Tetraselmis virus 1]AUF82497.1 hypothetical protein TetV_415 [Tetraselmis virus 1]